MNAAPVATCRHFWWVEPATARYSRETCQLCGQTRICSNVEADITNDWGSIPLSNVGKTRFDKRGGRR